MLGCSTNKMNESIEKPLSDDQIEGMGAPHVIKEYGR